MMKRIRIKRECCFECLEKLWSEHQYLYVGAQLGFGKTTMVTMWLEQLKFEYLYISMLGEGISEVLIEAEKKKDKVIVIDDLQWIHSDGLVSFFSQYLKRSNCRIIIIGRADLPYYLSDFLIEGQLGIFDHQLLYFRQFEIEQLMEIFCLEDKLSGWSSAEIHEKTKGWPVAVITILQRLKENQRLNFSTLQLNRDLFHYLDERFIRYCDDVCKKFLFDISYFETFDLNLARIVIDRKDIRDVFLKIIETSSVFMVENDEFYHFQPFFRSYLQEKCKKCYPLGYYEILLQRVATQYELNNDVDAALWYYYKLNNIEKIMDLLKRDHNDPSTFFKLSKRGFYYEGLREEWIREDPYLLYGAAINSILNGDFKKEEYWETLLNNFNLSVIREDYRYQTVRKLVLVLGVNSVNQTFSDFYKALDKLIKYCMMNDLIISEIHLTSGQPSILSSGNDMTKSLKDRDCFLALLQQAENISDHCMFGISDLFVGELAYECHHDGDQCEFLKFLHSGFLKVKESQSNELKFAYTGILCRFHISNGNLEKAKKTMQRFLNAESVKAEELLYINGNAFMAWLALFENDELSVMNWLLESQMESLEVCNMVNQYVKLMQIRVYIAKYDYEQAELIISQLLFYLQQTDGFYMEQKVMILRGYHFYKNNQMEWQNIIETVIENCREYQIIQLISEEGIVIYPLLLELSKKERYKKDCYFESVLKTAQKQAERYPFYLGAQQDHFMSTLTEREKRVLELMSMGKTNKEIAEILFISARTVKAHNTSIFSKLKVNNRGKAIKKYLTVN